MSDEYQYMIGFRRTLRTLDEAQRKHLRSIFKDDAGFLTVEANKAMRRIEARTVGYEKDLELILGGVFNRDDLVVFKMPKGKGLSSAEILKEVLK